MRTPEAQWREIKDERFVLETFSDRWIIAGLSTIFIIPEVMYPRSRYFECIGSYDIDAPGIGKTVDAKIDIKVKIPGFFEKNGRAKNWFWGN